MWILPSPLRMLLPILLLAAFSPVSTLAQFRRSAFTLTARTLPTDRGPILIFTQDAPDGDGWELHDAQVKDGMLTGALRVLHPQTIYDLNVPATPTYAFCEDDTCDLLYGLPKRFVLLEVLPGKLDAAVDGAVLHLSLKALHRAWLCKAKLPFKGHTAYVPQTTNLQHP